MNQTGIEWCDFTWNPFVGCSRVSEGCQNCYAERIAWRLANNPKLAWETRAQYQRVVKGGKWTGEMTLFDNRLDEPKKKRKPHRIFVGSMGDLFHENVPFRFIHHVWDTMKAAPQHIFMVLTKRPERMVEVVNRIYSLERMGWSMGFWSHVWLGVTVENQEYRNRIQVMMNVWAAKRFVSIEPMIGPVDVWPWISNCAHRMRELCLDHDDIGDFACCPSHCNGRETEGRGLDLVIVGGETGPGARPMHPAWVRRIRDDCQGAGVPFFFKQWGEWGIRGSEKITSPCIRLSLNGRDDQTDPLSDGDAVWMERFGKSRTGHMLDGREHREWPE